jgi:hypothetical protein
VSEERIRSGGFAEGVQPDPLVARLISEVAIIYEQMDAGDLDLLEWELEQR